MLQGRCKIKTILTLLVGTAIVVSGCRSRNKSQNLTTELSTPSSSDSIVQNKISRSIPVAVSKIHNSKFKIHLSQISVNLSTPPTSSREHIDQFIQPTAFQEPLSIADEEIKGIRAQRNFDAPALKWNGQNSLLTLNAIPGISQSTSIKLESEQTQFKLHTGSLHSRMFEQCPKEFLTAEHVWLDQYLKNKNFALNPSLDPSTNSHIAVSHMEFSPQGVLWNISCSYDLSWASPAVSKIKAIFNFKLSVNANQEIFLGIIKETAVSGFNLQPNAVDQNIHGTRFHQNFNQSKNKVEILRWSSRRNKIVIDDVNDATGIALKEHKIGPWIQEGLKIAVADLRLKFPELGRKLVLRTEESLLSPDIAFSTESNLIGLKLINTESAEFRHIKRPLILNHLQGNLESLLKNFESLGLISNHQTAYKDAVLAMTIHNLGDSLGLRPNYIGFGMNKNWGNDLQSNMSLVFMGLPMEFITDKIEWKPHDLLSLKILYHDLLQESSYARDDHMREALTYPLSPISRDGLDEFSSLQYQLNLIQNYLANTNHPKISAFRESNPLWLEQIKSLYQQAFTTDGRSLE